MIRIQFNRRTQGPKKCWGIYRVLIVLLILVWSCWAQMPCTYAQESPFSSSAVYRAMLRELARQPDRVHPSQIGSGELLKRTFPPVPLEADDTQEELRIETSLWRLEIRKNPWRLFLTNKVTHTVWQVGSEGSRAAGIGWQGTGKTAEQALEVTRIRRVWKEGREWMMEGEVKGSPSPAKLTVTVISANVIRLSINGSNLRGRSLEMSFGAEGPFYGLGERFVKTELDGLKVHIHPEDNWDTRIFPGHNWTYAPVPFLLSPHGLGLYIDTALESTFDFTRAKEQNFSVQIAGASADFYFLIDQGPKGVIRAYTGLTGRTPLSPPWAFGVWVCALKGRDNVLSLARRLRAMHIPASAIWNYDLMNVPADMIIPSWTIGYYGQPRDFTEALHQLGFKVLWYIKPYSYPQIFPYLVPNPNYQLGLQKRYLVLGPDGKPVGPDYPLLQGHKHIMTGDIDFTNPAAVDWWQKRIELALKAYDSDGWMEDYGEYSEVNDRFAGGPEVGRAMANLYTLFYHKITYLIATRLKSDEVGFARSGYAGSQGYTRVLWGGDQSATWDREHGLASVVPAGITAGLSGFAVWGPDIECAGNSIELYTRWTELGALTPVMRTHLWGMPKFAVDIWFDAQTIETFKRYAQLHVSLFLYFYTYAHEAVKGGLPIMRHPMLEFPEDRNTYDAEDEYFLGDKILVAPVVKEGATTRSLYLPKGSWVNYWTQEVLEGGRQVRVNAPLDQIPLFVRAGSVIPLLSPKTQTLATDLARGKYQTLGKDLIWRVFPASMPHQGSFTLYDGTQVVAEQGRAQTRIEGIDSPVIRQYEVIVPATDTPHRVLLSGKAMERLDDAAYRAGKTGWWWSPNTRTLHIQFTSSNFELTIPE